MSIELECQVLGAETCEIGKICPNENCDYRICNHCAEKILENSEEEIFNTFKCPACTRPVTYSFNGPKFIYKMKRCFKNSFNTISYFIIIASLIWSVLCWGRLVSMALGKVGFCTNEMIFFNERFLIYSIMGWLIFCVFLGCVAITVCIGACIVSLMYILFEFIYLSYIDSRYRTIIID